MNVIGIIKQLMGKLIPFPIRVEWQRLKRFPANLKTYNRLASTKNDSSAFSFVLSEASSPLERIEGAVSFSLQKGKERNIALAIANIDRIVIEPGRIFSYHHLVGRPTRRKGYVPGLELHDLKKSQGIGGGCCQISNMIYWLAINSGMIITEQHRHAFDLFPDKDRTVPFGCGATVFYNYRDLRFENPLPEPIMITMNIDNGMLTGKFLALKDPGFRFGIEERDHKFIEEDGEKIRENKIYRKILNRQGVLLNEELILHNRCKVMY